MVCLLKMVDLSIVMLVYQRVPGTDLHPFHPLPGEKKNTQNIRGMLPPELINLLINGGHPIQADQGHRWPPLTTGRCVLRLHWGVC